jgi:hypothetical protein
MVLRRIFGPKREEVVGDWRRLHNEELHNLYPSLNIIRMIKSLRMTGAGYVACTAEIKMHKKFWFKNLKERERPFGRPRHRWEDIRMDLAKIELESVDWTCMLRTGTSGRLL